MSKASAALEKGLAAFRRLDAAGLINLRGATYSLTERGKAQVSTLIGQPVLVPVRQFPEFVAALEKWMFQHNDDDTDDRALVSAACSLMAQNGRLRVNWGLAMILIAPRFETRVMDAADKAALDTVAEQLFIAGLLVSGKLPC